MLLSLWFVVLSSYSDIWQISFLSSSTELLTNWCREPSGQLTTMLSWKITKPEDPPQYLWEVLAESAGHIKRLLVDYLQESKSPMGHFASHAYAFWGMLEGAMGHS